MNKFYIGSDIVATYQISLYESSGGGSNRWEVQLIGSEKNQVHTLLKLKNKKNQVHTFRTRAQAIDWCLEQLKI